MYSTTLTLTDSVAWEMPVVTPASARAAENSSSSAYDNENIRNTKKDKTRTVITILKEIIAYNNKIRIGPPRTPAGDRHEYDVMYSNII